MYFKNELKHSKRFDHVTDDVMILFWSENLPRIKLSESYKAFLKTLPHRILGDFCMIIIIYFYKTIFLSDLRFFVQRFHGSMFSQTVTAALCSQRFA